MSAAPAPPLAAGAALTVSWLGEYLHNRLGLPRLAPLSPENSLPALAAAALLVSWWLLPRRPGRPAAPDRLWAALLLVWGLLHLLGGAVLSVLPLPVWSFQPAQTASHYAAHALYGAAQLPLICLAVARLAHGRRVALETKHAPRRNIVETTGRGETTDRTETTAPTELHGETIVIDRFSGGRIVRH